MTMPKHRPEYPSFILAGISVVGIIVLTAMHIPVPMTLDTLALGALISGGAITAPRTATPPA